MFQNVRLLNSGNSRDKPILSNTRGRHQEQTFPACLKIQTLLGRKKQVRTIGESSGLQHLLIINTLNQHRSGNETRWSVIKPLWVSPRKNTSINRPLNRLLQTRKLGPFGLIYAQTILGRFWVIVRSRASPKMLPKWCIPNWKTSEFLGEGSSNPFISHLFQRWTSPSFRSQEAKRVFRITGFRNNSDSILWTCQGHI